MTPEQLLLTGVLVGAGFLLSGWLFHVAELIRANVQARRLREAERGGYPLLSRGEYPKPPKWADDPVQPPARTTPGRER